MEGQCLGRECDLWGKRQLSQGPHKFCAMWGRARMAETGLGGVFGRYMSNLHRCQQELGSVTFSMLGSPSGKPQRSLYGSFCNFLLHILLSSEWEGSVASEEHPSVTNSWHLWRLFLHFSIPSCSYIYTPLISRAW